MFNSIAVDTREAPSNRPKAFTEDDALDTSPTIRNCKINDSEWDGIEISGTASPIILNNWIYGNGNFDDNMTPDEQIDFAIDLFAPIKDKICGIHNGNHGNRIYNEDGGIFILTALNDHVMKLIKISQLNNVLNLLPTVEEAIDAVFLKTIESDLQGESDNE